MCLQDDVTATGVCLYLGDWMRMQCGGSLLGVAIKTARMEEFAKRKFFSLFPLSQVY